MPVITCDGLKISYIHVMHPAAEKIPVKLKNTGLYSIFARHANTWKFYNRAQSYVILMYYFNFFRSFIYLCYRLTINYYRKQLMPLYLQLNKI